MSWTLEILSTPREAPLSADEIGTLVRLDSQQIAAVTDLLPQAIHWLQWRYGLICQATDYRLMVTALDAPRLMMPVGPVRAVTVITSPSASVVQSWKVRGEALYGKTGEMGTVDFLAGWPAGQLPHLIRLSLALIVRHWLQKPGDLALGELGEVAATVGQYVSLFVPRERVVRGREPWQL